MSTTMLGHLPVALTERRLPGVGPVLETPGAGWQVRNCGYCYVLYRLVCYYDQSWWESWEPTLPYGQATMTDFADAVQHLSVEVAKHGDRPARVA